MKRKSIARSQQSILMVCAALVFFVSAVVASHKTMGAWEQALFFRFYDLPASLRLLMLTITQAGSTWMVVIVTCALVARRKTMAALQVLTASLSTFFLAEMFKVLVDRPRPFVLLSNVQSRERFVDGLGFPSGHTAVTTVVVMLLSQYIPKKFRWLLVVWVGLVALSRVYLGVHAPLDILGGFALGIFMAELFRQYWLGLVKKLKLPTRN